MSELVFHPGDQTPSPPPLGPPPLPAPPARPSPGFLGALGWCVLFVLCTQVPGAVLAGLVFVALLLFAPGLLPAGDSLQDVGTVMNSPGMSVALLMAMGFTQVLVIGFSWLVIQLMVGPDWLRLLGLRRPAGRHALLVLAGFPAMVVLGNVSYELLKRVLPSLQTLIRVPGMEEMMGIVSGWPWPLAVLIIGLGPGIGEELWCRGFLGRGLVGRYGFVFGVLFTSFFFGLIHVDPCQGTMALLMGLWLHHVYLTTRSLVLPMLLHFLNNSLAVLASHLAPLKVLERPPEELPLALIPVALIQLLVIGWALYQCRARLATPSGGLIDWPPVEHPSSTSGESVVYPPLSKVGLVAVVVALVAGGLLLTLTAR